jgi:hypothetical protein
LATVDRAIFGEVRGAHDLITSSSGAPETVLSDLASHYTDRLLPTEIPWQPYSCGFPVRGHYVVTRTFSVKASRGGMVQTHAAIVSLEALDRAMLGLLLRLLPSEAQSPVLAPTAIDTNQFPMHHDHPATMPTGYPSLVRMLLEGRVPVWSGQEGFEDLVDFLWLNLWPEARRELRYRISAEPNDLKDLPATFVCTPVALRSNWNDQQFVDPTASILQNPSLCESHLLGLPAGRRFGELRDRLSFAPPQISGLKRLEQYVRMREEGTVDSIRTAVRLLNAMIPRPEESAIEKASVLGALVQKTIEGSEQDVLALRNLDVAAFESGPASLRKAIAGWLHLQIVQNRGGVLVGRAILVESHPWKQLAEAALVEAFSPWTPDQARLLWRWWITDTAIVTPSEVLIPETLQAEQDFALSIPVEIPPPLCPPVLLLCRKRKWYLLHSAVLNGDPDLTPVERLRSQLEIQPDLSGVAGLQQLTSRMTSSELIDAALLIQDARIVGLAGEALKREPALVQNIDASNPAWRAVWTAAVERGHGLFDGISQPSVAAHSVMDALLAGSAIAPVLIEQLAVSPSSSLASYRRRKEIWNSLPASVRTRSVATAAAEWLTRFLAEPEFDPSALEPELQDVVVALWRSSPARVPAASIPSFWQRFSPSLTEADFLSWLDASRFSLTQLEAVALGRLMKEKGWQRAADDLIRRAKSGRRDVLPSVYEFWEFLGMWDRLYFATFTTAPVIREDEWWDSFVELSIRLYPRGIEDDDIWYDADGDVSRVRRGTGREQWTHALDLLRKGGAGGSMTIEGLLHQMRKDFHGNTDLELLENVYLTRIRRQR